MTKNPLSEVVEYFNQNKRMIDKKKLRAAHRMPFLAKVVNLETYEKNRVEFRFGLN